MFAVIGVLDDETPYTLIWDAEKGMRGDAAVLVHLRLLDGRPILATPTGPEYIVDPDDPSSVLVALYTTTEVIMVHGEPPNVAATIPVEEMLAGAIY